MSLQLEDLYSACHQDEMKIFVEGPVPSAVLAGLSMNGSLDNFRPPERQKEALVAIAGMNPGLVFIARCEQEIVGYVTFVRPASFTRWLRHPRILELGAVEVSREWRRCYVASRLLTTAFTFPVLENYIVITLEYCWHWDLLKGTGLGLREYRDMLTRLFGKAGMIVEGTDDPDILEHPAKLMMARVGGRVPLLDVIAFEAMLYENRDFPAGAPVREA